MRAERDERVLVTTLTKKMSEDLTDYLLELGIRVRYLHSEVDTLRRVELLRELRLGEFDVLVGINLLREGLDLPEVSLVAILDADKEGFLRSATSLIQTIGRAARNVSGQVHMYADTDHPVDGAGDRRDQPAPGQAGRLQHASTASTRSRCARRSPTSPTCSPARTPTPSELLGGVAAGSSSRGQGAGARAVGSRAAPTASAAHAADLAGMPRAELADLIQQLTDQMHAAAGRAAVRAGRPAARRDRRAEEGAARHGRRRRALIP